MQISKITFEQCLKPNEKTFSMHYDDSDALRTIRDKEEFDEVRSLLVSNYGDVDVAINLNGYWFERVTINDPKWNAAHEKYCDIKQKWCDKYGCE